MLCSNQVSWRVLRPFLAETPPVLADWMLWNHTFGGNADCNMVLANGGALRVKAITAPALVAKDIVVTGHDCDAVGFMIFPNLPACRNLASDLPADAASERVLAHDAVKALVHNGLRAMRNGGGGSSTSATRARFRQEPPNIDAGEITDKGWINQRAVLTRRAAGVTVLHGEPPEALLKIRQVVDLPSGTTVAALRAPLNSTLKLKLAGALISIKV